MNANDIIAECRVACAAFERDLGELSSCSVDFRHNEIRMEFACDWYLTLDAEGFFAVPHDQWREMINFELKSLVDAVRQKEGKQSAVEVLYN